MQFFSTKREVTMVQVGSCISAGSQIDLRALAEQQFQDLKTRITQVDPSNYQECLEMLDQLLELGKEACGASIGITAGNLR